MFHTAYPYVVNLPLMTKYEFLSAMRAIVGDKSKLYPQDDPRHNAQLRDLAITAKEAICMKTRPHVFTCNDNESIHVTLADVYWSGLETLDNCDASGVNPMFKIVSPPNPVEDKRLVDREVRGAPIVISENYQWYVEYYGKMFVVYGYHLEDSDKDFTMTCPARLASSDDVKVKVGKTIGAVIAAACLIFGIYN